MECFVKIKLTFMNTNISRIRVVLSQAPLGHSKSKSLTISHSRDNHQDKNNIL